MMIDPSWAQILISIGGLLTPIVIAAGVRDRALVALIKSTTDPIHDRINRVRDEFVRRDDLESHLTRMDKQFDDMRGEMRRASENTQKSLEEIRNLLRLRTP